jgi:hypothetical protein
MWASWNNIESSSANPSDIKCEVYKKGYKENIHQIKGNFPVLNFNIGICSRNIHMTLEKIYAYNLLVN